MVQIIWSHGWGFNPSFFNPLCQALKNYPHHFIDWGYFNPFSFPHLDFNQPTIGIGHSLGFAKLLNLHLPLKATISLAGFTSFCPLPPLTGGTPKRVIERMSSRFNTSPHQVLNEFYKACGTSFTLPSLQTTLDTYRLKQDLDSLATITTFMPALPSLTIAGQGDQICPLAHQKTMFKDLKIIQGTHSFPQTRALETAKLIKHFICQFF